MSLELLRLPGACTMITRSFCLRYSTMIVRLIFAAAMVVGLTPTAVLAEPVNRADIDAWLAATFVVDPPAAGTTIRRGDIASLAPWLAPGHIDEFDFDDVAVEIQATGDYPGHPSFLAATENFAGQATIGADGRLENYTAGRPFTAAQLGGADPATAGYMVAWNQIHRWQYYGYKVDELTMTYLKESDNAGPIDTKVGLLGGGILERTLHQVYHRVYLNKLAMLPEQSYQVPVPDSDTRFFKDYIEFVEPFNIKGTKFVVERMLDPHQDDQVNTYLPTERRVRRVSAQERADSFMGSTSTLDDFEGFSGRVLDYRWTYLGTKALLTIADTKQELQPMIGPHSRFPVDRWQVRNCHVVEVKSTWDGHPYKSRVLFLDAQTYGVNMSLIFNHDDVLWKTMQTVYRAPRTEGSGQQALETSVHSWRGQVNVDRVQGTTTVVRALTPTEHPTMSKAKIKRIFSVSSLTSGQ